MFGKDASEYKRKVTNFNKFMMATFKCQIITKELALYFVASSD